MIERREILGLEFERVATEADFDLWCTRNGWPSAAQFEIDTFISFRKLKGLWFFVTKADGVTTVYTRSIRGGVEALIGEAQRHR